MPERDAVLEALTADAVANHYQISGTWRGRWLRSKRCPKADHGTDAMGLARDGKWHCHACDIGGDLLHLIAFAEGIDIRADFPAVLELAAAIAGVAEVDDFGGGKPTPPARPAPPPVPPLPTRIANAKKRAEYVWARLFDWRQNGAGDSYLRERRINPGIVHLRDVLKTTPIKVPRSEIEAVKLRHANDELERLVHMFSQDGIALPVRAVADGRFVDVRVRRLAPREDQPKVIGMLGGVTRDGDTLVGCYGHPHEVATDFVVVVEGLADYLTALCVWPEADVLGAVDAGSYPLVAAHAAHALVERGEGGRLLLVEQYDEERIDKRTGKVIDGAADRAVNIGASKRAIAALGPRAVGWLNCAPHKDLNDAIRAGAKLDQKWWADSSDKWQTGAM